MNITVEFRDLTLEEAKNLFDLIAAVHPPAENLDELQELWKSKIESLLYKIPSDKMDNRLRNTLRRAVSAWWCIIEDENGNRRWRYPTKDFDEFLDNLCADPPETSGVRLFGKLSQIKLAEAFGYLAENNL